VSPNAEPNIERHRDPLAVAEPVTDSERDWHCNADDLAFRYRHAHSFSHAESNSIGKWHPVTITQPDADC